MVGRGIELLRNALPRHSRWGFLAVCLMVAVAYWPSLHHLPRADHAVYLAGSYEFEGFAARLAHALTYGRARFLAPGDAMLYRPLFWALWPIEEATVGWFGAGPQSIGILL